MATIKIGNKAYRYEYFNKCEWCDARDEEGNCSLPEGFECEENYIFKREEYQEE